MKSLPLDMMTGLKWLQGLFFFYEKRSIGQKLSKAVSRNISLTIVQDTHVLCDKGWFLCVLGLKKMELKAIPQDD